MKVHEGGIRTKLIVCAGINIFRLMSVTSRYVLFNIYHAFETLHPSQYGMINKNIALARQLYGPRSMNIFFIMVIGEFPGNLCSLNLFKIYFFKIYNYYFLKKEFKCTSYKHP